MELKEAPDSKPTPPPPPARHVVRWIEELFPDHPDVAASVKLSLQQKPERIDKAYAEILAGYLIDPSQVLTYTREVSGDYHGSVKSVDIPFISICAHHFLP